MSNRTKQLEVLQLLKDWRPFHTAFGGAFPIDDAANMTDVAYGPAGFIETGAEFEKYDRRRLAVSMDLLHEALRHLARTNFPLWYVLQEPYIADPADPSMVDHWRSHAGDWSECVFKGCSGVSTTVGLCQHHWNRAPLKLQQKIKRISGEPREDSAAKVALHDKAIKELADYLKHEDLHIVYPKLLSKREEKDIEESNAAMLAFYRRLVRGGSTHDSARKHSAEHFRVSVDAIQRIVDVQDKIRGGGMPDGRVREPGAGERAMHEVLSERAQV